MDIGRPRCVHQRSYSMENKDQKNTMEQISSFRFPQFLIQKYENLCRLFAKRLEGLTPEQIQIDSWKIAKDLGRELSLDEMPKEIMNCINAYGYKPEQFKKISEIFERNSISIPLTDGNFEVANKIYELRKNEEYDSTLLFDAFFYPLLGAIQKYKERKEREQKIRKLDEIEYPEKIRELIAFVNKFYVASLEEKKNMREQLNQNPEQFRLFTHMNLTQTFSDVIRFQYNIKELSGREAKEGGYLGHNDGGRLYLVPLEEVFFQAGKGPDVLDRFFDPMEKGELLEEGKDWRGLRIKFVNLKHPVVLGSEGVANFYRVKQRGVLEIRTLE